MKHLFKAILALVLVIVLPSPTYAKSHFNKVDQMYDQNRYYVNFKNRLLYSSFPLKDLYEHYPLKDLNEEAAQRSIYASIGSALAKCDKDVRKGKKLCIYDALFGGLLYCFGKYEICYRQSYEQAAEYFKNAADASDACKMGLICCEFKLNKDKKAALTAMNSFKEITKEMVSIANKLEMGGLFNQSKSKNKWMAEKLPRIKRLIRSKDWEGLKEYENFGIPLVDSVLCKENEKEYGNDIYWQRCRNDGLVYGYSQNAKTILEYLKTSETPMEIFLYTSIIPIGEKKRYYYYHESVGLVPHERYDYTYATIINNITEVSKNNVYAGLMLAAKFVDRYPSVFAKKYENPNREVDPAERTLSEKLVSSILSKVPNINVWKECPLFVNNDGTVQLLTKDYFNVIMNKWKSVNP